MKRPVLSDRQTRMRALEKARMLPFKRGHRVRVKLTLASGGGPEVDIAEVKVCRLSENGREIELVLYRDSEIEGYCELLQLVSEGALWRTMFRPYSRAPGSDAIVFGEDLLFEVERDWPSPAVRVRDL